MSKVLPEQDRGLEDERLIEGLKARDAPAWAKLYDLHYTPIWRYVVARTGSRETADDVASQVFLEAFQSIDRFRPQGRPIIAWLYTIARNQASKAVRRRRKEVSGLAAEEAGPQTDEAVLDAIVVSQALCRLSKDQRDVIALRYYAGCSTREIAAVLKKSEQAVYSAESRALAKLRTLLSSQSGQLTAAGDEFRPLPGIDG